MPVDEFFKPARRKACLLYNFLDKHKREYE
nr:MAG TPA: hypothetical protein [Caudoviricetes sp.]